MRANVHLGVSVAILLMLGMILAGCGGSSDGDSSSDTVLLGTWTPISATVDDVETSVGNVLDWPETGVRQEVRFSTGGVVTTQTFDREGDVLEEDTGTYTGSSASCSMDFGEDVVTFTYSISGNVLDITMTEEGSTVEVVFVKVTDISTTSSELVGDWKIAQMFANGYEVDPVDHFVFEPSATADWLGLSLLDDGTFTAREFDASNTVLQEDSSRVWAASGGEFVLDETDALIRGYYTVSSTATVTVLHPNGVTVRMILERME